MKKTTIEAKEGEVLYMHLPNGEVIPCTSVTVEMVPKNWLLKILYNWRRGYRLFS